MKIIKFNRICLLLLIFVSFSSCISSLERMTNMLNRAQEKIAKDKKYKNPIEFNSNIEQLGKVNSFEDIPVMYVNEANLKELISKRGKFTYLVFFTIGCKGSPYEFRYIKKSDSLYPGLLNIKMISSDNIAPYLIQILQKRLFLSKINYQTYIIDKSIPSYLDSRKRGLLLRNQVCEECRNDIIGVPYIMLFSPEGKLLFHGYRGYKTTIPSDIITYFLGKSQQ